MDCSRFSEILGDFIGGELPFAQQSAAETHLENCPDCRILLEIVQGELDLLPPELGTNLTSSVLDRTSGNACARVESSLWDLAEGGLGTEESQLVSLHVNHCAKCSGFAEEIAFARSMLPSMAEIDPGESFSRSVVCLTSARPRREPYFRIRLRAWWDRMIQRPLFSLEAAYVATLLLFFMFSPVLPFREIAVQKLPSFLTNAGKPAGIQIQNLTSKVSWGHRIIAASIGDAWGKTESGLTGMVDRSRLSLQNWQRECTADVEVFWKRLSNPSGSAR